MNEGFELDGFRFKPSRSEIVAERDKRREKQRIGYCNLIRYASLNHQLAAQFIGIQSVKAFNAAKIELEMKTKITKAEKFELLNDYNSN